MIGNLNLESIQAGDENAFKDVFRMFGCNIEERPTFDAVKFYPFEDLLPKQESGEPDHEYQARTYTAAERLVQKQLGEKGWRLRVFGPDTEGNGFQTPRFKQENYDTQCIWVFQPYVTASAGSLSPAYNLLWMASHELGHGLTNQQVTELFGGQGKRRGALGISTIGNTFSLSRGKMSPLSLVDALRATEWEHHATVLQRAIVEKDFCQTVTDDQFLCEYQYNIAGSVIRTLWGFFCTPGELGVVPQANMSADDMNQLAQDLYRAAAKEMGLDLRERY